MERKSRGIRQCEIRERGVVRGKFRIEVFNHKGLFDKAFEGTTCAEALAALHAEGYQYIPPGIADQLDDLRNEKYGKLVRPA